MGNCAKAPKVQKNQHRHPQPQGVLQPPRIDRPPNAMRIN